MKRFGKWVFMPKNFENKYIIILLSMIIWALILLWLYYKIVVGGYDGGLILRGFTFGMVFSIPFFAIRGIVKKSRKRK